MSRLDYSISASPGVLIGRVLGLFAVVALIAAAIHGSIFSILLAAVLAAGSAAMWISDRLTRSDEVVERRLLDEWLEGLR